ncbi:MAG: hypothetical protein Q9195_001936 [Heterodermia aff. obscurata]
MEPFKVSLSNNAVVTGLASLPSRQESSSPFPVPLIVAIHGGTYSASYFFADDQHSALPVASALQVPFIAINRPGYKDSTPIPAVPEDSSYLQEVGKYLHHEILPALWKRYASDVGASCFVLLTHSLGSPPAIVAAALNAGSNLYPLAGLIMSGFGSELNKGPGFYAQLEMLKSNPPTITFPIEFKDPVMFGMPEEGMADLSIYKQTAALQSEVPTGEISDALTQWLDYWTKYAAEVSVPVMYGLADGDKLWRASEQYVRDFVTAFEKSPRVESGIILGSAHCTELCKVSRGWYARAFGFAMECAVAKELKRF